MREFAQLMPYRYTGKFTDYSTGLVQMDSRWYNGHNGRFIQPDNWNLRNTHLPKAVQHELMQFTGVNTQQLLNDPSQQMAYGYVRGNPLKYVDPYGLYVDPFGRGSTSSAYEVSKESMGKLSNIAMGVTMVSLASSNLPVAVGAGFIATASGYLAATLDDDPIKALTIETFSNVTGGKIVGTAASIVKGVKSGLNNNIVDVSKKISESALSNKLKNISNENECSNK